LTIRTEAAFYMPNSEEVISG